MATKIEKTMVVITLFWLLLLGVSCSALSSLIDECTGLKGVVESVWEGTECGVTTQEE